MVSYLLDLAFEAFLGYFGLPEIFSLFPFPLMFFAEVLWSLGAWASFSLFGFFALLTDLVFFLLLPPLLNNFLLFFPFLMLTFLGL